MEHIKILYTQKQIRENRFMESIFKIDPKNPGDFAPMLTGGVEDISEGKIILLGCKEKDKPTGILVATEIEDVIMLRWIVVEKEFQRQGIASKLISTLYQYANAKNVSEIDCVVCLPEKEQEIAKKMLMKNNFYMEEQHKMFSFTLSSVKESIFGVHMEKAFHTNIKRLSEVSNVAIQEFNSKIIKKEGFLPIVPSNLLTDYSLVWIEEGMVRGCLLLAYCDGGLEIQWIYSEKPLAVQELILAAAKIMVQSFPAETRIFATAVHSSVENLIRKLGNDHLKEEQTVDLYQCLIY